MCFSSILLCLWRGACRMHMRVLAPKSLAIVILQHRSQIYTRNNDLGTCVQYWVLVKLFECILVQFWKWESSTLNATQEVASTHPNGHFICSSIFGKYASIFPKGNSDCGSLHFVGQLMQYSVPAFTVAFCYTGISESILQFNLITFWNCRNTCMPWILKDIKTGWGL